MDIFGVPYERALRFHRFIGVLSFVLVAIHAGTNFIKWTLDGTLLNNVVSYDELKITKYYIIYTNFSITIVELAFLLMLISIIMAVTIRRKYYAIFQYSHKYIGIVFYVASLIHATNFWYSNLPALVLWLCDKWARGVATTRCFEPTEFTWLESNNTTLIKLSSDSLPDYKAGQYFFINIPCISLNQWHPFTASAVLDDGIVLYIKNMQKKQNSQSWTARLSALAMDSMTTLQKPMLRLNGPFGHFEFEGHETVLLFAGGIGITPMIAIFADLRKRLVEQDRADKLAQKLGEPLTTHADHPRLKRVRLVWMSRKIEEFRLFEKIFSHFRSEVVKTHTQTSRQSVFQQSAGPEANIDEIEAMEMAQAHSVAFCAFDIQLHCTCRASLVSLTDPTSPDYVKMFLQDGRVNVREVFETYGREPNTLAAVCGPPSLMHDVSLSAYEFGTAFHSEEFFF